MLEHYADVELPQPTSIRHRLGKHHTLSYYRRLALLVGLFNLGFLLAGLTGGMWWTRHGIALEALSNVVLVNLSIAILIRQQHIINLLFWLVTQAPTSWPLSIRWMLGKVYHFGGLHSGCAVSATVWFAILLVSMTFHVLNGLPGVSASTVKVMYALLVILLLMIVMALPGNRSHFHNNFEVTHRFGGWTALLLFWVQTVMFINDRRGDDSLGYALLSSPSFWMLMILSTSIVLPWLRLQKVPVEVETPSSHVTLAQFDYGVTPFAGSSTAISRNPLLEWHSFANIPTPGKG